MEIYRYDDEADEEGHRIKETNQRRAPQVGFVS
jgi:hypothetical protein